MDKVDFFPSLSDVFQAKPIIKLMRLLSCALLLGLPVSAVHAEGSQAVEATNVLAILPLSGTAAEQGHWSKYGLEIAKEELVANGLPSLNLIYEDSSADPRQAISGFNNVLSQQQLQATITWGSGVGIALTPLVNRAKVIQLGIATSSMAYRTENDFTFRVFHTASEEGHFLAKGARENFDYNKVAVFSVNVEYGDQVRTEFLKHLGAQPQIDEIFNPGTTDFRTQLGKLKGRSLSGLVLISYPSEAGILLKQMEELNIQLPVVASGAIYSLGHFDNLSTEFLKHIKIALLKPTNSELAASFQKRYKKLFGHGNIFALLYAARAYDALMLIGQARSNCARADSMCMSQELYKLKKFQGASGSITFDSAGDMLTTIEDQQLFNLAEISE